MARAKPKFSVLDVQRAMAGAHRAGFDVSRCEIRPDGTICVIVGEEAALDEGNNGEVESELTPLERWRAKRDARKQDAKRA